MSPEQFILMMNDLPDAVIDSANSPVIKQKHKIWHMIPAVAACFIALIAAAIYPKLRTQTPEIALPPVALEETTTAATTAVITEITVSSAAQIGTMQTQRTTQSVTMTKMSTVYTTAKAIVTTVTAEMTVPHRTTIGSAATTVQQTTPVVSSETKPNTDATNQTAPDRPIGTTVIPDEHVNEKTQAGPIIEQSISVPVLRSEPVFTGTDQETPELTCEFHEATEDDLLIWGNEATKFDRSAYKLICTTISGCCQDAVIVRGTIMNDDCQLLIAYLKEDDMPDPIQMKCLLAFPIEIEIQIDDLYANMSQVLEETFFHALVEECSQSITVQY